MRCQNCCGHSTLFANGGKKESMSSALTSKRLNNSSVASPETATSVEQTMENEAAAFEVL